MKTSLICLLLLAAVACAAPQAGEMPGEKREEMAAKMREKIIEKRREMAEKMREMTKEKREDMAEEKREEMAEKMREMAKEKREDMAEEKREEMAEKMREMAKEKREERAEAALGQAKFDEEGAPEARGDCFYLRGPCYGRYDEPGCVYDYCRSYVLDVDPLTGCKCCAEPHPCYLDSYDYYYYY